MLTPELKRLASLPLLQYEQEREAAAAKLGVRVTVVDKMINEAGDDGEGETVMMKPSEWLDEKKAIEQITWAPGEEKIISGRLVSQGGWIERDNHTVFNLYRPPTLKSGDASKAGRWIDHVNRIYPDDAKHIIPWCAHRIQKQGEKINHALMLGGSQGIGKDTLLEPVKRAVGPWNCSEVSPKHLVGRFNGYLKSVILRVSEARDLGEMSRYEFYEHMKAYTASPPDVLRVDEKNIREYYVFNCCGVVITTNHKTDGIYLPANDRRHYVAWSDLAQGDFSIEYWTELWGWYDAGGDRHVAAYLAEYDLSGWDAKAPPPKTAVFWDIVDANRAPEESELADALDKLGNPEAVALSQVIDAAGSVSHSLAEWLRERKNRRVIPYRLAAVGYTPVRNDTAPEDGLWKIYGKRQAIYA